MLLTGCGASVAKGTQGPVFWLWAVSAAMSFCIAWWLGGRLEQRGGERTGRLLVALLGVYVVGVCLGWSLDEASGLSRAQALLLPVFVAVAVGMSLLVRSWTSSTHIAWVQAVVAALVPLLAVTGRLLHWMYGDELGLSTSEMDVSGIWQAASALKLLTPMSALLLVPSAWPLHGIGIWYDTADDSAPWSSLLWPSCWQSTQEVWAWNLLSAPQTRSRLSPVRAEANHHRILASSPSGSA